MTVDQRRHRPRVLCLHGFRVSGVGEYPLDHQRVDRDQTDLQQLQGQGDQFLLIEPVGGEFPTASI